MDRLQTFGVSQGEGKYHEEAIYSLALIYNIIHSDIASYLKDFQLTPGKLNILIAIKHHGQDKGIRQVEISRHLIVTPSNMTKLVDKLEKEGLVTRSSLEGDRRVNIVQITDKGKALLEQIWEGYNNRLKALFAKVEPNKQKLLSSLLIDWFEILQKE
jgi:DNA-binding MarR family transcriptional regulator